MGFYDRWIFPWLVDIAMRNREATRYRALIVPQAAGRTLEIGVGSGLNLPFYGSRVEVLYALDPSTELLAMARKKARGPDLAVSFLPHSGDAIPLDDRSIDTVVMTWTLCSIADPIKALTEVSRVLKPGGALLFVEHGLAPDRGVQRWQNRLNRPWNKLSGGCNLNRKVDELIRVAGLRIAALDTQYVNGPRIMSFMYSGRAEKSPAP
jgi:ubiquinone/menaquinone biosynthesis C-methylase UbiE